MKAKGFLILTGALGLLLASCNPSGSREQSTVTLSVAFPTPGTLGAGVAPLGVPGSASQAVVSIYDASDRLVTSKTLTPSQPTTTVTLLNGTYAFETSAKRANGIEVAWAREIHSISRDTALTLKPKAIVGEAWLSHSLSGPLPPGEEVNVRLWVVEPGSTVGSSDGKFPLEDYDVSYSVGTCSNATCNDFAPTTAASIVSSSKTGVRVKANSVSQDTTVYVRAQVSGLGTNRNPTTLARYTSFTIPASSNVGIDLDFAPPQITLTNPPAPGSTVPVNQAFTLSGTASDTGGRVREIKVYVNSSEIIPTVNPALPAPSAAFSFSFTPDKPGRYDIDIVAIDEAGNSYRYYTYVQAQ